MKFKSSKIEAYLLKGIYVIKIVFGRILKFIETNCVKHNN